MLSNISFSRSFFSPLHFFLVLYLSESVKMLLLLLQVPLALLDELINRCSWRWDWRRNNHWQWRRRDINHVFGTWVVDFYKKSRATETQGRGQFLKNFHLRAKYRTTIAVKLFSDMHIYKYKYRL